MTLMAPENISWTHNWPTKWRQRQASSLEVDDDGNGKNAALIYVKRHNIAYHPFTIYLHDIEIP
jgi:hypothetical protein